MASKGATSTIASPASRGPQSIMSLAGIRCPPAPPTNLPLLPTTLSSLPTELLELILASCTNSGLLAISQTCTGLHAIALHTFFKRNDIRDPINGWLSAHKAPRETLDAIRVALFVKKLRILNWGFNPGWECDICNSLKEDGNKGEQGMYLCPSHCRSGSQMHRADTSPRTGPLKRTFDEVANLRAIVSRLEGVVSVGLHFSVVDRWLRTQPGDHPRIWVEQVDSNIWKTDFVGLIDEVLDKGCEELYVNDGEDLKDWYRNQNLKTENERPVPATMQATTTRHESGRAAKQVQNQSRRRFLVTLLRFPLKRLIGLVRRIGKTSDKRPNSLDSKSAHTPTKRRQRKLNDLRLHSDMLLLPLFYDWTLSILSSPACASTLTRLSFKPVTITIPSPFLASVNLPNLVEFEITVAHRVPRDGRAKLGDVVGFLGRHSSHLKKVYLYGVGVPPLPDREAISGSTLTFTPIFGSHKPIFPQLQSFSAHPAYILWLLDLAISTSPASPFIWQDDKNLGNLTSIGVTSEYYISTPNFHYALFDQALTALVRFCRWRNGERGPRAGNKNTRTKKNVGEKTIELRLTFASQQGVGEWFTSHLLPPLEHATNQKNSGLPAIAPSSILTQLTHVSLLTISTFHFVKLPQSTLDNLPEWLALVSNSSSSGSNTPGTPSMLQLVKFVDHPSNRFPGDEDLFVKRVAEKCVRLKWLQMNWKDDNAVDLDAIRAAAGPGYIGNGQILFQAT